MFVDPVQAIEYPEHVDSARGRLRDEIAHHVVGIVRVPHAHSPSATASAAAGSAWPRGKPRAAPRDPPSEIAAPHRTSRRPSTRRKTAAAAGSRNSGAINAMSWVRKRVARSDWCASRMLVSVSSTRFSVEHPCGEALGTELVELLLACRAAAAAAPARNARKHGRLRLRVALADLRIAVDDHIADEAQQPRRPIALCAGCWNSSGVWSMNLVV